MSQHCRANPCCGDRPCSGIPLPQDASGLPRSQDELDALLLEAKAEIERLREALEEIVDVHGSTPALSHVRQIARAELRRAALIPSEQKGDADGNQ